MVLLGGVGGGGGSSGIGGGGGGGPGPGGRSSSPSLGGGGIPFVDLPEIIRSDVDLLIAASMQGVAAVTTATVEERLAANNRGRGLSSIMRAHLRHICVVVGDKEVPSIWREMELARTKVEGQVLLSQFFLTGVSACQSDFHRHSDLLHIFLPLFNFVTLGAFTNHGNHLACMSGGVSAWASPQGLGGRGASLASNLSDIKSQDSSLANADNLDRGAKVTLSVIFGSDNLRR